MPRRRFVSRQSKQENCRVRALSDKKGEKKTQKFQLTFAFVNFWRVDDDDGRNCFDRLIIVVIQSFAFASAGDQRIAIRAGLHRDQKRCRRRRSRTGRLVQLVLAVGPPTEESHFIVCL